MFRELPSLDYVHDLTRSLHVQLAPTTPMPSAVSAAFEATAGDYREVRAAAVNAAGATNRPPAETSEVMRYVLDTTSGDYREVRAVAVHGALSGTRTLEQIRELLPATLQMTSQDYKQVRVAAVHGVLGGTPMPAFLVPDPG